MNNPSKELEKYFRVITKAKNWDERYSAVINYFRFIGDTYPLNDIAKSILSSSTRPTIFSNVNKIYGYVVLGESDHNFYIDNGNGISLFHSYMIENIKRVTPPVKEADVKKTIILKRKSKSICLVSEKPLCYTIKGEYAQRFQMVYILFRTETGKSAREIAQDLSKDGTRTEQDNIKKEIGAINEKFKKDLEIKSGLIISTKPGAKNLYFLNRKRFNFEVEK